MIAKNQNSELIKMYKDKLNETSLNHELAENFIFVIKEHLNHLYKIISNIENNTEHYSPTLLIYEFKRLSPNMEAIFNALNRELEIIANSNQELYEELQELDLTVIN